MTIFPPLFMLFLIAQPAPGTSFTLGKSFIKHNDIRRDSVRRDDCEFAPPGVSETAVSPLESNSLSLC